MNLAPYRPFGPWILLLERLPRPDGRGYCIAALRAFENPRARLPTQWLCHSDVRQVFDLPSQAPLYFGVSDPGHRPVEINKTLGKSETCRASEWQSH